MQSKLSNQAQRIALKIALMVRGEGGKRGGLRYGNERKRSSKIETMFIMGMGKIVI